MMRNRRHWWQPGLVLLVFLLGCLGTQVIDLSNPFYISSSADAGYAVISAQGWAYTGGLAYGQYGIARIAGGTGALSPGTSSAPWGFGQVADPTPNPVGWSSFTPGGGNVAANSMALASGTLYVTGPAVAGTFLAAGFGTVSTADGSVANVRHFSPRDVNNLGGYLGDTPGGDIFIVGGKAYVFGTGAAAPPVNDIVWTAERMLDGQASSSFGDSCGPGCRSGFATFDSGYNSVSYGDTKLQDDIAYSVFRTSAGTEGRILVTAIDLGNPSSATVQRLLQDGSTSSQFRPYAIAIQDDGKILVAGADGGTDTSMFVIRYDPVSGIRDTTFGGTGIVELNLTTGADQLNDIGVMADGKIMVVGKSGASAFSARLLADGTWDGSYATGGYKLFTPASGAAEFIGLEIGQLVRATGASAGDLLIAEL